MRSNYFPALVRRLSTRLFEAHGWSYRAWFEFESTKAEDRAASQTTVIITTIFTTVPFSATRSIPHNTGTLHTLPTHTSGIPADTSVIYPNTSALISSNATPTASTSLLLQGTFTMSSLTTSTTTLSLTSTVGTTLTVTVTTTSASVFPLSSSDTSTDSAQSTSAEATSASTTSAAATTSVPSVVVGTSFLTSVSATSIASSVTSGLISSSSTTLAPSSHTTPIAISSDEIAAGPVSQHAAVIGGVMGSLSVVAFMGVAALLIWRKYRKRELQEYKDDNPGLFSYSRRKSRSIDQGNEKGPPNLPEITISQTPIVENNLIRMSLAHWDRPYAHDDPFRDPDRQSYLRVTNPDLSRPPSPPISPETPRGFMSRQVSALAVALAGFKRTGSSQSLAHDTRTGPVQSSSTILESPCQDITVPPAAVLGSSRLRPQSSRSSEFVYQMPPPDPFPDLPPRNPSRLLASPIRHVASRTPSYNDRPLTFMSSMARTDRSNSSSSGRLSFRSSSDRRFTSTSDPFEIDPRGHLNRPRPGDSPNWAVHAYEET